jgi:Family of unknown function (DUF5706)
MGTTDRPDMYAKDGAIAEQSELIGMAKLLFDHIENQIKAADSKAWLTIAANTILANLFVGLTSEIFKIPGFSKVLAAILSLLMFGTLLGSVLCALLVVKPSFAGPQSQNLFFFGDIQRFSLDGFTQEFNRQSLTDVSHALLAQVYVKSKIAHRKFNVLVKGLYFFFASFGFGAIAIVTLNVSRGI